jgi:hypothetical protein
MHNGYQMAVDGFGMFVHIAYMTKTNTVVEIAGNIT